GLPAPVRSGPTRWPPVSAGPCRASGAPESPPARERAAPSRRAPACLAFHTGRSKIRAVDTPDTKEGGMGWVVLGVLALLVLIGFGLYNALVRLRVAADGAWSNIDTQLKRRHDLVPNLVETVKGYAAHERGVFERVTEARSRA